MRRFIWAVVALALSFAAAPGVARAQSNCIMPRADQVHPSVSTVVSSVPGSRFVYTYTVTALNDSPKPVSEFWVASSPTDNSVTLTSPPDWNGLVSPAGYYNWIANGAGIAAGQSLNSFGVNAVELPSIVTFLALNEIAVPVFPRGAAPEACQGDRVIDNSFKGSTVGPKTPPSTDPIELVNYLISLVHDARRLNWIKRDGPQQSLLAKLITAKRKLEQGDIASAKSNLSAFVNEVEATSCDDFTCHGNKPSTSEAYALLKFNGDYLISRLP
jgi:hypothetical protein